MLAVYRNELKLRFFSISSYLLLFLIFLCFGILFSVFNLSMGYASLSYSLGYMSLVLVILLPFLAFFRAIKEKGNGTSRFLCSLPLSSVSLVLGDFLATATLLLIPFSFFSILPLILSMFGESPVAASETALFGAFLFCLFLVSLIRFLFCLIKRPAVSLAVSLGVTLFFYFLNTFFFYLPLPEEGFGEKLSLLLNPTGIYYSFTYGKFNLPGTVYFLTLTALFLFLQVLLIKKRRGDFYNVKKRILSAAVSALLLLSVILSNVFILLLPERIANSDVTGSDIFRISGASLDLLHALDEPVTLYFLCEGGRKNADKELLSFLKQYKEESPYLELRIIDPQKDSELLSSYTSSSLRNGSLIVAGEERYRIIDISDLYYYENKEIGQIPAAYYDYLISSYVQYQKTGSAEGIDQTTLQLGYHLYYSNSTVAFFNGDKLLSNAVSFVSQDDVRNVYIATSNQFSFSQKDTDLETALSKNNFFVSHLDSIERIPEDCDLLILFSPKKDIGKTEKNALEDYLARGGHLFLTTDYASTDLPNLLSLLSTYGLSVSWSEGIVCEADEASVLSAETPYYFSAAVHRSSVAKDFKGRYLSILSHPIVIHPSEGIDVSPVLSTTEKGFLSDVEENELVEEGETYVIGALSQKEASSVFWISSHLSVSSTANTLSSGGNILYILSVFEDICPSKNDELNISPVQMSSSSLILSSGDVALWTLIVASLIPLFTLFFGVMYTFFRRKK